MNSHNSIKWSEKKRRIFFSFLPPPTQLRFLQLPTTQSIHALQKHIILNLYPIILNQFTRARSRWHDWASCDGRRLPETRDGVKTYGLCRWKKVSQYNVASHLIISISIDMAQMSLRHPSIYIYRLLCFFFFHHLSCLLQTFKQPIICLHLFFHIFKETNYILVAKNLRMLAKINFNLNFSN